jgi:hypothetical protein
MDVCLALQTSVNLHRDVEGWASQSSLWGAPRLSLGLLSSLVWTLTYLVPTQNLRARARHALNTTLAPVLDKATALAFDAAVLPLVSAGLLMSNTDTVYYTVYVLFAWLGTLYRWGASRPMFTWFVAGFGVGGCGGTGCCVAHGGGGDDGPRG